MNINNLFKHLTYQFFAPGTLLRGNYEAFRDLLEHDRTANELVSEFEEIYYSSRRIDYNMLNKKYQALSQEVSQMMEALFKIAPASYLNLRDFYKKIDFYIRFAIAPPEISSDLPFAIIIDDLTEANSLLAGGKAANLGKVVNNADIKIPASFVITTNAFNYFIECGNLLPEINEILSELDIESKEELNNASTKLKDLLRGVEIPDAIRQAVGDSVKSIKDKYQIDMPFVAAVRSSASHEDSEFSFAGQYKSILGVTEEDICEAYREVLLSKYSPEAIYYRINAGLHDAETPMAVLVMEMAETAHAGVMYTSNPETGSDSTICIHVVSGCGDKLVDGSVTPDVIEVDKINTFLFIRDERESGISSFSINKLVYLGKEIESIFGCPMDIEWAVDKNGEPVILQARSLHLTYDISTGNNDVDHIEEGKELEKTLLCRGGVCASRGTGSGVVFIVQNEEDLDAVPDRSVVLSRSAPPSFTRIANRVSAVITEFGSSASHFASVSREASLPFIAGMKEAFNVLRNGQEVTVCAQETAVYEGISESVRKETIDPEKKGPFEKKMEYMLKFISALRLTDPDSPEFRPEGCRSLHDIIRFVHETGLKEMFFSTCKTSSKRQGAIRLESELPLQIFLLDVKDGVHAESRNSDAVSMQEIASVPMLAIWNGLTHKGISWSDFDHFDWKSFDAVVMAGGVATKKSAEFASYAVISKHYMNLNMRFGYHFTVVDTLCSIEPLSNYISLRFAGGGGDYQGRQLRLLFLTSILRENGFSVKYTGDLIDARIYQGDIDYLKDKLDLTGRLLGVTRVMDMTLKSEHDVRNYIELFMNGDYSFTAKCE